MGVLNPNFKYHPSELPSADELFEALKNGDRLALARAISLLESTNPSHRKLAAELIRRSVEVKTDTLRIGISGVPGVGKSTFIEAFGNFLIDEFGYRVAVLAIDPSSQTGGGSIMGDKTRMARLASRPEAFIRPSPSGNQLGGVNRTTRESLLLCEAAGFDVILVETVGVGQSETAVYHLTDFFMVLMLANAGDELQGIKRGIMELAHLVVINKADGENLTAARRAAAEYARALHLLQAGQSQWSPHVCTASALTGAGMAQVYDFIDQYRRLTHATGYWKQNRLLQQSYWYEQAIASAWRYFLQKNPEKFQIYQHLKSLVESGEVDPFLAAEELFEDL
ncbi:ATPase/protein kinase [Thermaurantimonas aggregans]|uniref:ATPase/protein kinase n=1 Tax=Thermaurantimonas aggregans TaxID=2173829 RepID=A0A401XNE8_9FLAO|nr:ATPase/protein kinase [Thermaurantimonas aggregans]